MKSIMNLPVAVSCICSPKNFVTASRIVFAQYNLSTSVTTREMFEMEKVMEGRRRSGLICGTLVVVACGCRSPYSSFLSSFSLSSLPLPWAALLLRAPRKPPVLSVKGTGLFVVSATLKEGKGGGENTLRNRRAGD